MRHAARRIELDHGIERNVVLPDGLSVHRLSLRKSRALCEFFCAAIMFVDAGLTATAVLIAVRRTARTIDKMLLPFRQNDKLFSSDFKNCPGLQTPNTVERDRTSVNERKQSFVELMSAVCANRFDGICVLGIAKILIADLSWPKHGADDLGHRSALPDLTYHDVPSSPFSRTSCNESENRRDEGLRSPCESSEAFSGAVPK